MRCRRGSHPPRRHDGHFRTGREQRRRHFNLFPSSFLSLSCAIVSAEYLLQPAPKINLPSLSPSSLSPSPFLPPLRILVALTPLRPTTFSHSSSSPSFSAPSSSPSSSSSFSCSFSFSCSCSKPPFLLLLRRASQRIRDEHPARARLSYDSPRRCRTRNRARAGSGMAHTRTDRRRGGTGAPATPC